MLGGLAALFYAEENWRGARIWANTRHDLETRGVSFDRARFIPPPVPDDQNLAFDPFFERIYQYKVDQKTGVLTFPSPGNTNEAKTADAIPFGSNGGPVSGGPGWQNGRALDLLQFQRYYRSRSDFPRAPAEQAPAADVLLALTHFGPLLDELARATERRPLSRFPVNWTQQPPSEIALPHYNLILKLVSLLRLRACALLSSGKPDSALRDIVLGLRLRGAIASEPTLICNLIDVTCCGLLAQPMWEGLHERCWSASQLGEIQKALGQVDILSNYSRTVQAERADVILPMVDVIRQSHDLRGIIAVIEGQDPGNDAWLRGLLISVQLYPHGWFDEAKSVVCQLDQRYVVDPVNAGRRRINPRMIEAGNTYVHNLPLKPSTFAAKLFLPVACSVQIHVARGQTIVDQANVACALERYYLDRQSYPSSLEVLIPAYLKSVPTDIIDGAPLRYRLTEDGRYCLWAIGWNGLDEAGKVVRQKGSTRLDDTQGDWVTGV